MEPGPGQNVLDDVEPGVRKTWVALCDNPESRRSLPERRNQIVPHYCLTSPLASHCLVPLAAASVAFHLIFVAITIHAACAVLVPGRRGFAFESAAARVRVLSWVGRTGGQGSFVLGCEVSGRWSEECRNFLSQLSKGKVRGDPPHLKVGARHAWHSKLPAQLVRWLCRCWSAGVARALTATLHPRLRCRRMPETQRSVRVCGNFDVV